MQHPKTNPGSAPATTVSESEASATNTRFNVILKGKEFKRNLPSSMAEYPNLHFNAYIPDKDVEEQLLTENPVSSNLQQVKPLDNFMRSLLPSQTVTTSYHEMERFLEKIQAVIGHLSHLWKGLEDIRKAPSDKAVEVPVDKFVTLVEQVTLLLGQASLSVSYTRRLNILKMIAKDPRKAKAMLKENENILRETETHLFGKKFRSHMIEIEKSREKSLDTFKGVGERKPSFQKSPSHSQNTVYHMLEGAITMRGNQVIETKEFYM